MNVTEILNDLRGDDSEDALLYLSAVVEKNLLAALKSKACEDETVALELIKEALINFKAAVRRGLEFEFKHPGKEFETLTKYLKVICIRLWFRYKKKSPLVLSFPSIGSSVEEWNNWIDKLDSGEPSWDDEEESGPIKSIGRTDIDAVLAELDEIDQYIIKRHYLQVPPDTLVEIAEKQGVNYDTIKKRHIRVLPKLRKLLVDYLTTKQTVK